jgi:cytoskeletal protein CcmA (bactofilin family)
MLLTPQQPFRMTSGGRCNVDLDANRSQTGVPGSSLSPGSRTSIHLSSNPVGNRAIGRSVSCVAPGLRIQGEITGNDDLQIDGDVEGTIVIPGQRLTVGRSGQLHCNVEAGDVVIYGKVVGDLTATGLVEIKKDGSVIGDIRAARISVEDGAYFKGSVDMEGFFAAAPASLGSSTLPTGGATN